MLAAVKYVPERDLPALAEAGIELVGENRAQDLLAKQEAHGDLFTWDFIGQLQSRKVKDIAPHVRLIHSLASESAHAEAGGAPRQGGADPGERGRGGGEGRHRARGAGRLHRPLPRARDRPDDDAALRGAARGQPPPLRPAGGAGGRARPRPPLDGHLPGLRGRGRGGRHDRAPGLACSTESSPRARRSRAIRFDSRAPCQASGESPLSSTTSSAFGSLRQYSSATPSGWSQSESSCEPTTSTGTSSSDSASRPFQAIERGTSRSACATEARSAWRSIRWRVASRATSRQRSGRLPGCATSRNLSMPAVERLGELLPGLAVGVAGARVAGVGGRDLHERRHPLGVLERERHRRRGAHRAAHERRPLQLELVEHGLEVAHQVRVLVARPGLRLAVAARVVGDQPVAALHERPRALHDVPPRGRQPVDQHDRRALAERLALQRDAAGARKLPQNLEFRRLHAQ